VIWTNLVNATASGNTLTSTAVGGHGESSQTITSGNGSVKETVNLTSQSSYLSFGLNSGTFTGDYNQIDYAWLYYADGTTANVRMNGVNKLDYPISNNDTLEVRINGTSVEWYRNATLVYTATNQSFGYPFRMAATFNDSTGQIKNAIILP
jgi:hypothetical protein